MSDVKERIEKVLGGILFDEVTPELCRNIENTLGIEKGSVSCIPMGTDLTVFCLKIEGKEYSAKMMSKPVIVEEL